VIRVLRFGCCAALRLSIPKAMCGCLLYCGVGIMGNICYGKRGFLVSPSPAHTRASWTRVDARHVTAAHATPVGPPMNRDGKILVSGGVPETQAQPPCLLRYSPQLWAKELPTMFAHDAETNTLSLQPGRHPPWIRKTAEHDRASTRESTKTWLYCTLGVTWALAWYRCCVPRRADQKPLP